MPDIYVAPKKKKKEPRREKAGPSKHHHLGAFLVKPKGIRFETQERKEKIILLLRRHWVSNLSWIFLAVFMSLAPSLLRFFPLLEPFPERYQTMAVVMWYLLTVAFILENFLSWYFNVNLVTDERIVDIDFYSLIYKEISHCKIDKIQDVSFKMGGILHAFFDFGDVIIQTASEVPVFEFDQVPNPALVVKKLNQLLLEEEQEKIEGRVT